MPLTMATLLADVRGLWSRERSLIVAVAAPFLFLPTFAIQLLTPPPPRMPVERTQATIEAWFESFTQWSGANGGWYLLAEAIAVFGAAALTVLLVDRSRPTVAGALLRAVQLWPRFLLASVLAAIPVGLGMWLILPGLYFQARFVAGAAALVEEPVSAAGALGRSWRSTEPTQLPLFATMVLLLSVQWTALIPLAPLDDWLREPAHLNPVVLALVDAAVSAVGALYQVAVLLVGVSAYRRLAS